MNKKTFISNQELEFTQKIQLQFPRGVIPVEVLTYWENCHPNVLRAVLKDVFYFSENIDSPVIKIRKPIPFKLPHDEMRGRFYFKADENNSDFDVRDITITEAKEISSKPKELLSFYDKNQHIIGRQLDIFQLWAIYLRGYDFFLRYFQGTIYAIRSVFVVNDDVYFPGVTVDVKKEKSLRIGWYSSWNYFSNNDFIAWLKN